MCTGSFHPIHHPSFHAQPGTEAKAEVGLMTAPSMQAGCFDTVSGAEAPPVSDVASGAAGDSALHALPACGPSIAIISSTMARGDRGDGGGGEDDAGSPRRRWGAVATAIAQAHGRQHQVRV